MMSSQSSSLWWNDYYDRSDAQADSFNDTGGTASNNLPPMDILNETVGPMFPTSFYPTTVPMPECGVMNYRYNVPTAVICGISFIFGIIFNFFGRYFCAFCLSFFLPFFNQQTCMHLSGEGNHLHLLWVVTILTKFHSYDRIPTTPHQDNSPLYAVQVGIGPDE